MRYECPEYAARFKCTANRCTDSCCIGWEIGIDEETYKKYNTLEGEIGEKIRKNLDTGATCPTFKLTNGKRCPMLTPNNLCEIILEKGEEFICEICREHPRFYNILPDCVEWGVGLSCEAAAELILESDTKNTVTAERETVECDGCDENLLAFLRFSRERIYELADSSPLPFFEKLKSLLYYAEALTEEIDSGNLGTVYPFMPLESTEKLNTGRTSEEFSRFFEILSLFDALDFLDSDFKKKLQACALEIKEKSLPRPDRLSEEKLARIFKYFIYRYFITAVFDGDVLSKIKLAVILTLTVHTLTQNSPDLKAWVNAVKALSKEAEYNEENLDLLTEMAFTESPLSTDSLLKLLS